jgi:hypothetical protein
LGFGRCGIESYSVLLFAKFIAKFILTNPTLYTVSMYDIGITPSCTYLAIVSQDCCVSDVYDLLAIGTRTRVCKFIAK